MVITKNKTNQPSLTILWLANIIAAIIFGLGHLPATVAIGAPLDMFVISRAVVLNGLGGICFGWLYFTYGLESAMIAHFSADIILHVIL
jgi:membrane protease YdiL (CAAX protease family)